MQAKKVKKLSEQLQQLKEIKVDFKPIEWQDEE